MLTRRHRVETLSWRGLVAQEVPVPADVHAHLRSRAMAVAARNLRMRAQCDALLALFAAHDVEVMTLKGGMLGAVLYGDHATKTSLDIDLLVPAGSLEQAISLLEAQGYRHLRVKTRLNSRQIEDVRNLGKELCFVQRETGWVVDLHWALVDNPALLDEPMLLADAGLCECAGEAVAVVHKAFTGPTLFAYLCVHGTSSGWYRLSWLSDLHALLAGRGPEEIDDWLSYAEGLGAGGCAAVAFAVRGTVFEAPVPARARELLKRSLPLQAVASLCLQLMCSPAPHKSRKIILIGLLLAVAGGGLGRVFRQIVFLQSDALQLGLPAGCRWLYPLLRLPMWLQRRLSSAKSELPR